MLAIICFVTVVLSTLVITRQASRRTTDRSGFYAAHGSVSASQNGLAIAGDFISAATLLGTTAIYFASGVDAALYLLPFLLGLGLILIWLAGPLRTLGRYTLGDVVTARLESPVLRAYSGLSTIVISLVYLVAQLVGAGALISVLFGTSFEVAVVIVGALMSGYVTFGGMLAATWVQVIKAIVLIGVILVLAGLCLLKAGGLGLLYDRAQAAYALGPKLFQPGGLHMSLFSTVSLVAGLALGTMGLPHLLIRAFTVRDAAASRRSVAIGAAIIGGVLAVVFGVIAPATVAFVANVPEFQAPGGGLRGGPNMAVIHLASAVGGDLLLGVTAAIAFATILAVVAGLTVATASAAANDLYASVAGGGVRDERHELRVFRLSAIGASVVAVALAILLQHENIAVLVAAALVLAASANFPVVFLSIYWPRLTVPGAVAGGGAGLLSALLLLTLGPAIWVKGLGHAAPLFPSDYPTLVTLPLAFVVAVLVSLATSRNAPSTEP